MERFRTEQVCGRDAVMGVPTRWAVGYSLEPPALVPGAPPMHGPNEGAFGHMGAGGQIGFADPVGARGGVASSATTWRTRPSRSWAPAWWTCCTRAWGRKRGRRCTQLSTPAEHPDQPAIIMAPSGRTLTFAEYEAAANQVAHVLRETGLRKGDHMAIFMENHPAVLLAEAGAERTGLYFTPVNSYLSAEEVAYVINDSRSRVVVTSTAKADVAAQLPALCPDVERWIMVDTTDGGRRSSTAYESWDDAVGAQPTDHVPEEQMGAPMMYSSGTTGRPKGILRPMYDIHPSETSIGVLGIAGLWRLREGMVYLSPAPLYHTAPQVSVAIALRMKSTAVVMEHFDPALYLELVGRYGVTHSQVVPTMFSRMLKLPDDVRAAADVSSLEVVIHAAAPVPGAGEGADDRVVRADPARVLRGHGGQRVHVHHVRRLVGAQGQRRAFGPERHPDPRRRRAAVPGRHVGHGVVRRRHRLRVLQRPREDGRQVGGTTGRRRRWATSGTWTRTATCS